MQSEVYRLHVTKCHLVQLWDQQCEQTVVSNRGLSAASPGSRQPNRVKISFSLSKKEWHIYAWIEQAPALQPRAPEWKWHVRAQWRDRASPHVPRAHAHHHYPLVLPLRLLLERMLVCFSAFVLFIFVFIFISFYLWKSEMRRDERMRVYARARMMCAQKNMFVYVFVWYYQIVNAGGAQTGRCA